MGCQRYQSWITDEALGALAENRQRELLAHASECAACHVALDCTRVLYQAIALGMAETVSAEPTPELTARVRQRISQTTQPTRGRLAALFPVAAGALAVAALFLIWLRPHAPPKAPDSAPPLQSTATIRRPPTELPRHSGEGPAEINRSAGRARSPEPAFEVLVPPGELQAVVQFVAALNSAGVVRAQLKINMEETRNPLDLKSLDFPALEVTKLEQDHSASESGSR